MGSDEGPWGKRQTDSGQRKKDQGLFSGLPNDLEGMTLFLQQKIRKIFPPGRNVWGTFAIIFCALLVLWFGTGVYLVQPNEQGVVLRFGEKVRISQSGLNFHIPYPVETVLIKDVTAVNRIESGSSQPSLDPDPSTLMLTGDENIVEVNYTVLWIIKDVEQYLFNARSPDDTVRAAAESVVREIMAQTPIASALTEGRSGMNQKAQAQLQVLVDQYGLGIQIQEVVMGRVDPPGPTLDHYRDVQRAKADQERARNNAESYRNSQVPLARGMAQTIIQGATGQAQAEVAVAKGSVDRFKALLEQYKHAPDIVSRILYIETMADLLKDADKVILTKDAVKGTLPYLPLPALRSRKGQAPASQPVADSGGAS